MCETTCPHPRDAHRVPDVANKRVWLVVSLRDFMPITSGFMSMLTSGSGLTHGNRAKRRVRYAGPGYRQLKARLGRALRSSRRDSQSQVDGSTRVEAWPQRNASRPGPQPQFAPTKCAVEGG